MAHTPLQEKQPGAAVPTPQYWVSQNVDGVEAPPVRQPPAMGVPASACTHVMPANHWPGVEKLAVQALEAAVAWEGSPAVSVHRLESPVFPA